MLQTKKTHPLRYAIGMLGTSIPINMFKTYAAAFYIDQLKLITTTHYSLILLIYTIIDAVDNPLYGFFSDRTRTKWGRRRPWLLIGAPLLVLCFILFFNPPEGLGEGSAFAYVTLFYVLTGTLDSLISTNYGALFPELFNDEKSRGNANALRQVFQYVAMVISIALTPMVAKAIGYRMTAIIYGLVALGVIVFMTLGTHEDIEAQSLEKPDLWRTLKEIVKNKHFWIYGITNAMFFAGLGLVQQGMSFYVKYALNIDASNATILLGTFLLATLATIPVWVMILRKVHVLKSWRIALIVITAALVPLYFTGTLISALVVVVFFGFGLAGVSVTMDIIAARILDNDRIEHQVKREGSFSSLLGIMNKSGGLFTSLGFLLMNLLYGYVDGNQVGPNPDGAARFMTVLFPLVLFVICVLFSRLLSFKENNRTDAEEGRN